MRFLTRETGSDSENHFLTTLSGGCSDMSEGTKEGILVQGVMTTNVRSSHVPSHPEPPEGNLQGTIKWFHDWVPFCGLPLSWPVTTGCAAPFLVVRSPGPPRPSPAHPRPATLHRTIMRAVSFQHLNPGKHTSGKETQPGVPYGQLSKVQSGKMAQASGIFELSKGMLK